MRTRDDRGSSVVDFVLVSTLLVFLLFAVLHVAVLVYARNVVAAASADGARDAAQFGSTPEDGARRATEVLRRALPGLANAVRCVGSVSTDQPSGLTGATVRCSGRLRAILVPLDLPMTVDSSSTVLREQSP